MPIDVNVLGRNLALRAGHYAYALRQPLIRSMVS